VPEFCTCGAQLPPDARFCHKCGKPQYDYMPATEEAEFEPTPQPALPELQPLRLPADIGFHNGLAVRIGFIAAIGAVMVSLFPIPLPFVRLPLAFVLAGFLAVFLYSRRTGQTLSIRSGARMGWITGIFSFMFVSILFTVAMVMISNEGGLVKFFRSQLPPNDARAEQLTQALSNPATLAGGLAFSVILLFIILTVLPVLGGALGAKVFAKE